MGIIYGIMFYMSLLTIPFSPTVLRKKIDDVGITQADFSRLLGVTPRAVSLWLSGVRSVPPTVVAYLRVFNMLDKEDRQFELGRLKAKEE